MSVRDFSSLPAALHVCCVTQLNAVNGKTIAVQISVIISTLINVK